MAVLPRETALAGCGKRPFLVPLDSGLHVMTGAVWLARGDAVGAHRSFCRTHHELHHMQCGLLCAQRVTDSGAWYQNVFSV
jgi:hypothetical protein